MSLADRLLEKNKYKKIIGLLAALFVLLSVIYTFIYFENLEKEGNFTLYKDIAYANYPGYDKSSTSLDIYVPNTEIDGNYPVMMFIHGGAWTKFFGSKNDWHRFIQKGIYMTDRNFILVNINYRLSPEVKFPAQQNDAARAVRWVYDNIEKYDGNKHEIYLKGHSAGAQIAALISTDPTYLRRQNLDLSNIKGTILLEGVGYDLLLAREEGLDNGLINFYYQMPFGDDQALKKASTINYIKEGKDIPPMLIFASEDSVFRIGKKEAKMLHNRLQESGYYSELYIVSKEGHSSLNREFGEEDHVPTKKTMEFLEKINS